MLGISVLAVRWDEPVGRLTCKKGREEIGATTFTHPIWLSVQGAPNFSNFDQPPSPMNRPEKMNYTKSPSLVPGIKKAFFGRLRSKF